MSTNILSLFLILFGRSYATSECLSNIPSVTLDPDGDDLEWSLDENTGYYQTTIEYDVATLEIPEINLRLQTRLYNGQLPGPTLRMRRGNTYQIILANKLGPEAITNPTDPNIFKDPNTTNVHTHGIHVSGAFPADHVFTTVHPGETKLFTYHVPCNHAGGTFWYHAHHHGSTYHQVALGAVGALIMEEDQDFESLEDWYVDMEEFVLVITSLNLAEIDFITDFLAPEGYQDDVYKHEKIDPNSPSILHSYLINGQYKPTLCVTAGEWFKLRLINHDPVAFNKFRLVDPQHPDDINLACELKLLAYDGVIIRGLHDTDLPRDVSIIYMGPGNRADVAVYCPGHFIGFKRYEIQVEIRENGMIIDYAPIGYVNVDGGSTLKPILTQFTPRRPKYLTSIINNNDPTKVGKTLNVAVTRTSLAGEQFQGEFNYLEDIEINKIHTININSKQADATQAFHPLHIHVNHFQISDNGIDPDGVPNGYQVVGDFGDTYVGDGIIKMMPDTFGGTVVLHCHILIHEDRGAMGTLRIPEGCGPHLTDDFGAAGACEYDEDKCEYAPPPDTTPTPDTTEETDDPDWGFCICVFWPNGNIFVTGTYHYAGNGCYENEFNSDVVFERDHSQSRWAFINRNTQEHYIDELNHQSSPFNYDGALYESSLVVVACVCFFDANKAIAAPGKPATIQGVYDDVGLDDSMDITYKLFIYICVGLISIWFIFLNIKYFINKCKINEKNRYDVISTQENDTQVEAI